MFWSNSIISFRQWVTGENVGLFQGHLKATSLLVLSCVSTVKLLFCPFASALTEGRSLWAFWGVKVHLLRGSCAHKSLGICLQRGSVSFPWCAYVCELLLIVDACGYPLIRWAIAQCGFIYCVQFVPALAVSVLSAGLPIRDPVRFF